MEQLTVLTDTLGDAQRVGFLGDRPVAEVIEHARSFLPPLAGVTGSIVDLGSGGGVPGLVIAAHRPDLDVVLVDRRQKRTDFLDRVVRRPGWPRPPRVVCGDAAVLGRDPHHAEVYAAAVSRGFGPPERTLAISRLFVPIGGLVVLTDPPAEHGDRWTTVPPGLERLSEVGSPIVVFRRI